MQTNAYKKPFDTISCVENNRFYILELPFQMQNE